MQPILSELNTNKQAHVEVSTGNIRMHTVHLQMWQIDILSHQPGHPKQKQEEWLTCAYRNSTYSTSPQNLWGCLSVFFVSVRLRDHLFMISGVPTMTAVGASPGPKVEQTTCGPRREQPPEGECGIRRYVRTDWAVQSADKRNGRRERMWGRNSHDLTCGGDTWWGGTGRRGGGRALCFVAGIRPLDVSPEKDRSKNTIIQYINSIST